MTSNHETPPESGAISKNTEDLLDEVERMLDQDAEDKKTLDKFKNPFVRKAVVSLIVLLFLIFFTYFLSFILEIPLPESKLLENFMTTIVEVMKILLPG